MVARVKSHQAIAAELKFPLRIRNVISLQVFVERVHVHFEVAEDQDILEQVLEHRGVYSDAFRFRHTKPDLLVNL